MRVVALCVLALSFAIQPALAQRRDSTPLAKAPPTVAPCLAACETEFARCESFKQATTSICPESRRVCFQRCDPAGLSKDTLKGLKQSDADLRYKPRNPMTPLEQCRQGCQDRRAMCLSQNGVYACDPATSACYDRCDVNHARPLEKSRRKRSSPR